jgi:hypothetical protein
MFRSAGGSGQVRDGKYVETMRYGMADKIRETNFGKETVIDCFFHEDLFAQYMVFDGKTTLVET